MWPDRVQGLVKAAAIEHIKMLVGHRVGVIDAGRLLHACEALFELLLLLSLLKTPSALWALKLRLRWNYIPGAMRELIFAVLYSLCCSLRTRTRLHLEIIALRHRLGVLKRNGPVRLRLKMTDRWLWVLCPDSGPVGARV